MRLFARRGEDDERGSALVMAVFVLVLLAGMGGALLFMSTTEQKMGKANLRTIEAFYLAEAGVEDARTALWHMNRDDDDFDNELADAAGDDDVLAFDVTGLEATRSGDGTVTGFTGYDDDEPVVAFTQLGKGGYMAFLTNDHGEGRDEKIDDDDRVMITSVGAGSDGSFEVVEAVIELRAFLPGVPPATITILGPQPLFGSAKSKTKVYEGADCSSTGTGDPLLFMPVLGAIGSGAVDEACPVVGSVICGMDINPAWQTGALAGFDVAADLTDPADPAMAQAGQPEIDDGWRDCWNLRDMMEGIKETADVVCADATLLGHSCIAPASNPDRIIYAEGDFVVGPGAGAGTLAVAGELTMSGNTDWSGLVLVIGEGVYRLNGAGNGTQSGGMIIADIAGPDNIFGNADDCTGGDGGFDRGTFDERGGGNAAAEYCSTSLERANPIKPYDVTEFLQR